MFDKKTICLKNLRVLEKTVYLNINDCILFSFLHKKDKIYIRDIIVN